MKTNNIQKNIFIIILFFIIGITAVILGGANEVDTVVKLTAEQNLAQAYTPLAGKELGSLTSPTKGATFTEYLNSLYEWGIAFAVVIAIISITWGGFVYMTTDAVSGKTDGKNKE